MCICFHINCTKSHSPQLLSCIATFLLLLCLSVLLTRRKPLQHYYPLKKQDLVFLGIEKGCWVIFKPRPGHSRVPRRATGGEKSLIWFILTVCISKRIKPLPFSSSSRASLLGYGEHFPFFSSIWRNLSLTHWYPKCTHYWLVHLRTLVIVSFPAFCEANNMD